MVKLRSLGVLADIPITILIQPLELLVIFGEGLQAIEHVPIHVPQKLLIFRAHERVQKQQRKKLVAHRNFGILDRLFDVQENHLVHLSGRYTYFAFKGRFGFLSKFLNSVLILFIFE